MEIQTSELAKLSISELESLLAEKRRREGKRVLRSIAAHAPGESLAADPTGRTVGTAPNEAKPPKGKTTRRLRSEETRALERLAPLPAGWRPYASPAPADRFRRTGLAAVSAPSRQRRPAWLWQPSVRRRLDLALWSGEILFCILLLYVFAQWVYTDFLTTTNVAADMTGPPPAVQPVHPAALSRSAAQLGAAFSATTAPTAVAAPDERDNSIRPALRVPSLSPMIPTTALTATTASPRVSVDSVVTDLALPNEIRIPKINLDARVREVNVRLDTWEWEVADYMTGHNAGAANPGETGNVVIAGHRDIKGSVFLHLDKLKQGDDIYVYSGLGTFHYVVRKSLIVKPTQVEVMASTTDQRLTLITCTPVHIATSRLIVIADLDTSYVAPERTHP